MSPLHDQQPYILGQERMKGERVNSPYRPYSFGSLKLFLGHSWSQKSLESLKMANHVTRICSRGQRKQLDTNFCSLQKHPQNTWPNGNIIRRRLDWAPYM